jgi:hypothetical protein
VARCGAERSAARARATSETRCWLTPWRSDLALGQPAAIRRRPSPPGTRAAGAGHGDRLGRGGALAHEQARVAPHRELLGQPSDVAKQHADDTAADGDLAEVLALVRAMSRR